LKGFEQSLDLLQKETTSRLNKIDNDITRAIETIKEDTRNTLTSESDKNFT
jgi:vacuolar-type H+-ATPase subunit H